MPRKIKSNSSNFSCMRTVVACIAISLTCIKTSAEEYTPLNEPTPLKISWSGPGKSAQQSMPAGNGDITVNAWTEENGDLLLYVGKNDSWGEHGRLLKVGKIRISTKEALFAPGQKTVETVGYQTGTITITSDSAKVSIWVDAHNPVIHVETETTIPTKKQSAVIELWRTKKRELSKKENHYVEVMPGKPALVYPDVLADVTQENFLKNYTVWYHRNDHSVYEANLKHQAVSDFAGMKEPLYQRTFGCSVGGRNFRPENSKVLASIEISKKHHILISCLTKQTATPKQWLTALAKQTQQVQALDYDKSKELHCKWWHRFSNLSDITVSGGGKETNHITTGWHAHRYLMGCAGRGSFPIKFNGSTFTVGKFDREGKKQDWITPDYRNWGAPFWFQNMRHIYWPMLEAGD